MGKFAHDPNAKRPPNRVRELRKAKGLTLAQLCELLGGGMKVPNLSNIEKGLRDLKPYWAERIAAALGVAQADLVVEEQGGLSAEERELIQTIREIPPHLRTSFYALRDSVQAYRGMGEVVQFGSRASDDASEVINGAPHHADTAKKSA